MRVLTMNLWGVRGDWEARRAVLIDGLRKLQPDLVAFQETIVTDDYDQVADLLPTDFHVHHHPRREAGQGLSIASRWPLARVEEMDLRETPRTADFECSALLGEVHVPTGIGRLLFVNHLPNWQLDFELERELQTVRVARRIEELVREGQMHVLLVGDLDAVPEASTIRFWRGLQSLDGMSVCYRDAWESAHRGEGGETLSERNGLRSPARDGSRRIDYIFVRCSTHKGPTLDVVSAALAFDEPRDGVWASDHFGVVADLEPRRPLTDE
jgi:endonuclease/exonuclease/phosphatase family metal-dependent hydrolase